MRAYDLHIVRCNRLTKVITDIEKSSNMVMTRYVVESDRCVYVGKALDPMSFLSGKLIDKFGYFQHKNINNVEAQYVVDINFVGDNDEFKILQSVCLSHLRGVKLDNILD